jgi:hypothetical protein
LVGTSYLQEGQRHHSLTREMGQVEMPLPISHSYLFAHPNRQLCRLCAALSTHPAYLALAVWAGITNVLLAHFVTAHPVVRKPCLGSSVGLPKCREGVNVLVHCWACPNARKKRLASVHRWACPSAERGPDPCRSVCYMFAEGSIVYALTSLVECNWHLHVPRSGGSSCLGFHVDYDW